MRIDAMNKVSQVYKSNSTQSIAKAKDRSFGDTLEISQMGKDYQIAKQAVAKAADIREDKVNDIKQRIEAGTYNISSEDLADKLLEQYFS